MSYVDKQTSSKFANTFSIGMTVFTYAFDMFTLSYQYNQKLEDRETEVHDLKATLHKEVDELNKLKKVFQDTVKTADTIQLIQQQMDDFRLFFKNRLIEALAQIKALLSGVVDEAFYDVQNTIQFLEYRMKRDDLFDIEEMTERFIENKHYTVLMELKEECENKSPNNFLMWLRSQIVDVTIEPALLPAIIKIGSSRFFNYRQWMAIVVGDAVKAVGYQIICNAAKQTDKALFDYDIRFGENLTKQIIKTMEDQIYNVFNKSVHDNTNPYSVTNIYK